MKKLVKRVFLINGTLLICAVALSLFFLFVKSHGITAFDCAFLRVFGVPCPSCGATRAVLALLTLHVFEAFTLSPGVCVSVFLLLVYDVICLIALVQRRPELERAFSPNLLILIPVTFLLTFLIRLCFLL